MSCKRSDLFYFIFFRTMKNWDVFCHRWLLISMTWTIFQQNKNSFTRHDTMIENVKLKFHSKRLKVVCECMLTAISYSIPCCCFFLFTQISPFLYQKRIIQKIGKLIIHTHKHTDIKSSCAADYMYTKFIESKYKSS